MCVCVPEMAPIKVSSRSGAGSCPWHCAGSTALVWWQDPVAGGWAAPRMGSPHCSDEMEDVVTSMRAGCVHQSPPIPANFAVASQGRSPSHSPFYSRDLSDSLGVMLSLHFQLVWAVHTHTVCQAMPLHAASQPTRVGGRRKH